jgi:hypothetical protein
VGRFGRLYRLIAGVSHVLYAGHDPASLVALCSNVAFLIYAGTLHLLPIMILHGALIPVNVCRLIAARRSDGLNFPIAAPLASFLESSGAD